MIDRHADTGFAVGDRIVHLGEHWYRDYRHRTGTVVDINPCGTTRYGNHGDMRVKPATKLKVRWDRERLACGRFDQTALSWVLADLCRLLPTAATPDEPFAIREGEAMPLYDLPESRALVEAVGALESIPTNLVIALEPFRMPEPPPVIEALRPDDV